MNDINFVEMTNPNHERIQDIWRSKSVEGDKVTTFANYASCDEGRWHGYSPHEKQI